MLQYRYFSQIVVQNQCLSNNSKNICGLEYQELGASCSLYGSWSSSSVARLNKVHCDLLWVLWYVMLVQRNLLMLESTLRNPSMSFMKIYIYMNILSTYSGYPKSNHIVSTIPWTSAYVFASTKAWSLGTVPFPVLAWFIKTEYLIHVPSVFFFKYLFLSLQGITVSWTVMANEDEDLPPTEYFVLTCSSIS